MSADVVKVFIIGLQLGDYFWRMKFVFVFFESVDKNWLYLINNAHLKTKWHRCMLNFV